MHKARLTPRRFRILQLMAKGYSDDKIAKELDLSKSNYNLQRWRLYCYIGGVHKPIDAVIRGLEIGLMSKYDLSEVMKEKLNNIRKENGHEV